MLFGFFHHSNGKCAPDAFFLASPVPGVYPPNIAVPGIPFFGLDDGQVSVQYNQDLTLIVLEDTTLDVGFLLPSSVVTAMNFAGISTTMTVDVNYVSFDVTGLPSGLMYACDIGNCEYPSSTNGCIGINGIPIQNGTFSINVNMIVNIQIPAITTLFSGMSVDLPSFAVQQYDLFIDGPSSSQLRFNQYNLFPNPTSTYSKLHLEEEATINIYNVLGEKLKSYNNFQGNLYVSKLDLGVGMFYICINEGEDNMLVKKLIIK